LFFSGALQQVKIGCLAFFEKPVLDGFTGLGFESSAGCAVVSMRPLGFDLGL
jgi:hypothetical protein